jgi:RNA polymerase sigma-70 factor (ECF subfamily)
LAEDITQDVMLKLHAAGAGAPQEADRRMRWALRVARHRIIDHYRSAAARPALRLADEPPASGLVESSSRELAGCLRSMVHHLPVGYREAVELSDLQGHSQASVARRLGISVSGAKSRVQRGRQQLRGMLDRCCRIEIGTHGSVIGFEPRAHAAAYCGDEKHQENCVQPADTPSTIESPAVVAG